MNWPNHPRSFVRFCCLLIIAGFTALAIAVNILP